jgi:hypothetical protein
MMIDWTATATCAAGIVSGAERTWGALDDMSRCAPAFQNKNFPLSPLPLLLRHQVAAELGTSAEAYVRLLNKIVRLFLTDESVRHWYGLGEVAEALVMADRRLGGEVAVCRLDGYLERATERPVLLENNADAPAGSMFTARINRMIQSLLDQVGACPGELSPLTYTDEASLLRVLGDCAARGGVRTPRHVAILQPAGAATRESVEMAAAFTAHGVDAYLADPRSLSISGDRAYFAGRPADVCWNKVNTAPWCAAVAKDAEVAERWIRAVSGTSLVHVNPFGARYVAENKLSVALPQEPRFGHLFTAGERALAARLLPWGRKVDRAALAPDGTRPLIDDLWENPAEYVLKQSYDIRGDGVTIGRAVSHSAWRDAVERAVLNGHLAQRYVPPTAYPTVSRSDPAVVPMPVSLDTYVLNGRVRGFGSKASLNARVNVFQGGQKLAVHVVAATARSADAC